MLEIERKFLLKNDGWKSKICASEPILQAYVASSASATGISVRVRVTGQHGYLTFKGPRVGIARSEYEYQIPIDEAKAILRQAQAPMIEKVRHLVQHGNLTWEIDVFKGDNKGLIVAEVELESVDQAIELPDWIGKEVTAENKYRNSRLAINPFLKWGECEQ